jgi:hypothetical protein
MKKKNPKPSNRLMEAMEFLSLCQKGKGKEQDTHCILSDHSAVAFNGIVAMGQLIDEDLFACPHTDKMALALASCGETFSITQVAEDRLLVRSGDFQAFVPCCQRSALPTALPDAQIALINDNFKHALKIVAPLASEKGEHVVTASIQVNSGNVVGTNREIIIEAWHGVDLPVMLMPKQAATAIIKVKRKLTGFGYSGPTATFWYEDGSWLKTNLFEDKWPDVVGMLNLENRAKLIEPAFFEAVKTVAAFSENGNVYCGDGFVSSHYFSNVVEQGSHRTMPVENGIVNRIYTTKGLLTVGKHAKMIDESAGANITLFFGDNLRGGIFHQVPMPPTEDDIPF